MLKSVYSELTLNFLFVLTTLLADITIITTIKTRCIYILWVIISVPLRSGVIIENKVARFYGPRCICYVTWPTSARRDADLRTVSSSSFLILSSSSTASWVALRSVSSFLFTFSTSARTFFSRSRFSCIWSQRQHTPCPEKREQQYCVHDFNKFRRIFVIFGKQHESSSSLSPSSPSSSSSSSSSLSHVQVGCTFHWASAVAEINSSQWIASSPASCKDCSRLQTSRVDTQYTLTIWFTVCCWSHRRTHRGPMKRDPICEGW